MRAETGTKKGGPGRKPGRKPRPDRVRRIETVCKLISLQVNHCAIVKQVSMEFACSQRTVWSDLKRAYAKLETTGETPLSIRKQGMRASLRMLFQRAVQMGNIGNALGALEKIARLDGLYEAEQININHGGEIGVGINVALSSLGFRSADEVEGRIAELEEKLGLPPSAVRALPAGNGKANGRANGKAIIDVPVARVAKDREDGDDGNGRG